MIFPLCKLAQTYQNQKGLAVFRQNSFMACFGGEGINWQWGFRQKSKGKWSIYGQWYPSDPSFKKRMWFITGDRKGSATKPIWSFRGNVEASSASKTKSASSGQKVSQLGWTCGESYFVWSLIFPSVGWNAICLKGSNDTFHVDNVILRSLPDQQASINLPCLANKAEKVRWLHLLSYIQLSLELDALSV